MTSHILFGSKKAEYYFKEGCHITELSNSEVDPEVSIARARLEPGKATRWHALKDTKERYLILQGTGLVEAGGLAPTQVNPGDSVIIAPEDKQRIKNTGESDLVFLAICSPRFEMGNYVDLED